MVRAVVSSPLCVFVCVGLFVCFAPHVRLGERRCAQRLGGGGVLVSAQLHKQGRTDGE
jgi:hypothetical protein